MGREHELRKEDFKSRYFVLLISNLAQMTFFFCFDNPAALKDEIQDAFKNKFDPPEFELYFSLFYSLYSLPNVVLPLINGKILDKYGARTLFVWCVGFAAVGQTLFAYGFSILSIHTMIIGRIFLGVGSESLLIALSTIIAEYFRQDDLSLSISINLAFGNIGIVLSLIFSPLLSREWGTEEAIWFGSSISLVSVIAGVVSVLVDKRIEKTIKEESLMINSFYFSFRDKDNNNIQSSNKASNRRWRRIDSGIIGESSSESKMLGFPKLFWFMACSSALTYSTIMSFSAIAPSYIASNSYEDLSLKEQTIVSSRVASIIWITSVVSSPLFGIFVDRIGLRSRLAIFSAILSLTGFLLVVFIHAAFPVFLLGFAYAGNFASVWVSIAYIVDRGSTGKAFGITIALQNLGFTIFPLGNAIFKNAFDNYDASALFLACLALLSFLLGVRVHQENKLKGGFLELSVRTMDKFGQETKKTEYGIEMVMPELRSKESIYEV